MQLRKVFQDQVKQRQIAWGIIEQDYVLSWLLFGISETPKLKDNLVFKGGTALKKIYFGDYRFSQDLDFTALPNAPRGAELEYFIELACMKSMKELGMRVASPMFTCSRYIEKRPHPNEQEAFVIRAQLPWHSSPCVRVMIEVTFNQSVEDTPLLKNIIHGYPEECNAEVLVYSLNEIFAEKLLAMHHNTIKLHEQGWSRSRVRDYYDLWRLMCSFRENLDELTIRKILQVKCKTNHVFNSVNNFFDPLALSIVNKDWAAWLGQVIYPVPDYDLVVPELMFHMNEFFNWDNKVEKRASEENLTM